MRLHAEEAQIIEKSETGFPGKPELSHTSGRKERAFLKNTCRLGKNLQARKKAGRHPGGKQSYFGGSAKTCADDVQKNASLKERSTLVLLGTKALDMEVTRPWGGKEIGATNPRDSSPLRHGNDLGV